MIGILTLFLGFRVSEVLLSVQGLWDAYGYLERVQGLGVFTTMRAHGLLEPGR